MRSSLLFFLISSHQQNLAKIINNKKILRIDISLQVAMFQINASEMALVTIRLFGSKILPQIMPAHCQLDPSETHINKFYLKVIYLCSRKCFLGCDLQNDAQFVLLNLLIVVFCHLYVIIEKMWFFYIYKTGAEIIINNIIIFTWLLQKFIIYRFIGETKRCIALKNDM